MGGEETSYAIFYSAARCALGNGGSQEGKGEVQSVVTLNPLDGGYINFSSLCLSETDILQAHRRWSSLYENMDVKRCIQTRAVTALCCFQIRKMEPLKAGCQWKNQQV